MMMGGRLEANVEEDLFKVGIDTMWQYELRFTGLVSKNTVETERNLR